MDEQTKRNIIVQELGKVGLQANESVPVDRFYGALDKLSVSLVHEGGEQFDRFVGGELMAQLGPNKDRPNPQDFSRVWVEAEKRIIDKINQSQGHLDRMPVESVEPVSHSFSGPKDRKRETQTSEPGETALVQNPASHRILQRKEQRLRSGCRQQVFGSHLHRTVPERAGIDVGSNQTDRSMKETAA